MKETPRILIAAVASLVAAAGLVLFVLPTIINSLFPIGNEAHTAALDMHRWTVPGSTTFEVEEPGTYWVFYEFLPLIDSLGSRSTGNTLPKVKLSVTDLMSPNPVYPKLAQTPFITYNFDSCAGVSLAKFPAPHKGQYRIDVVYSDGRNEPTVAFAVGQLGEASNWLNIFILTFILTAGVLFLVTYKLLGRLPAPPPPEPEPQPVVKDPSKFDPSGPFRDEPPRRET